MVILENILMMMFRAFIGTQAAVLCMNLQRSPEMLLPIEMQKLIEFVNSIISFSGSNADFVERYNQFTGRKVKANSLKRMMNRYSSELEESGVCFESCKRNNVRVIDIFYKQPPDGR